MAGISYGSTIRLGILCLALFCGLAASMRDSRAAGLKEMVGAWHAEIRGDSSVEGRKYNIRRQIELNRADGTKIVTFRYYAGNKRIFEQIITFSWGAENDVYWAVCQSVASDGRVQSCSQRTEYDILSVDDQTLRYRSRSSGTTYNHKRVEDNFRLP
jgi:hypothetical protein